MRAEDAIPTATLDRGFDKVLVFDDAGAIAPADPDASDEQPGSIPYLSGLHAKAYVAEFGQEASVWLGSLNATEGAINRNVEFLIELIGPKRLFGIEALLREDPKTADFADLLQPYQPPAQPLEPDPEEEGNRSLVEQARHALVGTPFGLEARADGDAWSLHLMTPSTIQLKEGATVSCWPIRMTEAAGGRGVGQGDRGEIASWKAEVDSLTSFIAFQVSGGGRRRGLVEAAYLRPSVEWDLALGAIQRLSATLR